MSSVPTMPGITRLPRREGNLWAVYPANDNPVTKSEVQSES